MAANNEPQKVSAFDTAPAAANTDFLVILKTDLGVLQKIDVLSFMSTAVPRLTPANSSITVPEGFTCYDDTYFYIATSNNVLKRITLEVF
jgi:hypothetical protein